MMDRARMLRERLERPGPLLLTGAYDALTARLIEQAGFDAVYVGGAGVTNALLGMPDLGLLSFGEMLGQINHIVQATTRPIIVDIDTGHGNAINTRRVVSELEQIGVSGIHIEDQTFPKRCGHFESKGVIELDEMCGKIRAVADARKNDDFLIIARTDARAVFGLDDALERGEAYVKAGADALFIEAPTTREELEKVGQHFEVPLVANMVDGGKTPVLPLEELDALGFSIVLYATYALRVMIKTVQEFLAEFRDAGSTLGLEHHFCTFAERQAVVDLAGFEELERYYGAKGEAAHAAFS